MTPKRKEDNTIKNILGEPPKKLNNIKQENPKAKQLLHKYINISHEEDFILDLVIREDFQNDIRIKDEFGNYPIYLSCLIGYHRLTLLLLEKYPYAITKQDSWKGSTNPLHAACFLNVYSQVNYLIENYYFLVFATNSRGRTPLFSAVDSNSAAIISALLKQATKCINHRDHNGETALILACKHCCFTAVLELLSYHDIDVNIMDKDGISAMYYLLKKYLVYHVDEDHIHFNDFKQVLELMHVKHPSAFYYINPSGGNLFHELAAHRYPELENKKLFLRSIYHMVNDYDNTGKTPLLTASKNCNSHVIDFIGWIPFADFSLKDLINGKSALHYLCENMICPNYLESFLHDYKINVNAIDNNGDTAVHSYCKVIDVSKPFRKPENCIKIIKNVLNQNIFLSIKKNHSGEIISDILNSKIDEAMGYHLPVTIQTIKNCYEIIKDFEKKARWLIFQYFMLNAADENTPLATI